MLRRLLLLLVFLAPTHAFAQYELTVEPYVFETGDGRTVDAELGRFRVPENRSIEGGRMIELAFVRFPTTNPNPGPPIVYLAGGPGGSGSGTARGSRFDLFQSLRSVADVIAFDQRGTGLSAQLPDCPHRLTPPLAAEDSRATWTQAAIETIQACAAHWDSLGVDLSAYTTQESADDLNALREVLNADQIALWAISYGTHLGLSAIRRHPDAIARAVLAGVEGPDHTLKLPSHQQTLLERIAAIDAERSPESTFLADIALVLDRLREAPHSVDVPTESGSVRLLIGAFDVQALTAGMLGSPDLSLYLPGMFAQMRDGEFGSVAHWMLRFKSDSSIGAMSAAMDAASGASPERLARIAWEADRTLLGDAINFPANVMAEALGVPDLGDGFRSPILSDVPVLFISGTLDGRTAPENADEVRAGFSRHAHLLLEGAGHSDPLFLSTPLILDRMQTFLSGAMVDSETIAVDLPERTP